MEMSRNNNTEMQTDFLGLIVQSESQLPIIVAPKGCVVAMGRRLPGGNSRLSQLLADAAAG